MTLTRDGRGMARFGMALALAGLLAGCGVAPMVGRGTDGGATLTGLLTGEIGADLVPARWNIARVEVTVPRSLTVSEANLFVPRSDIVWHGDPLGDRHEQVRKIVSEAAEIGTRGMRQGERVVAQVEMLRFHALTPKARYTTGGNYAMRFMLTVRDAQSGEILDGPRLVLADTPASGGQRALAEEAQGITQKVVIVAHLADVLTRELSRRMVPAAPVLAAIP